MEYQKIERIANKDQADEVSRLQDLTRAAARVIKKTYDRDVRPDYALELLRKVIDAGVIEEYDPTTTDCILGLHHWDDCEDEGGFFFRSHFGKRILLVPAILLEEADHMESLLDDWLNGDHDDTPGGDA